MEKPYVGQIVKIPKDTDVLKKYMLPFSLAGKIAIIREIENEKKGTHSSIGFESIKDESRIIWWIKYYDLEEEKSDPQWRSIEKKLFLR